MIYIDGLRVQQVSQFKYLGNIITEMDTVMKITETDLQSLRMPL
jgi:hypothetical protein